MTKLLIINPGSTSTKVSYFEDEKNVYTEGGAFFFQRFEMPEKIVVISAEIFEAVMPAKKRIIMARVNNAVIPFLFINFRDEFFFRLSARRSSGDVQMSFKFIHCLSKNAVNRLIGGLIAAKHVIYAANSRIISDGERRRRKQDRPRRCS